MTKEEEQLQRLIQAVTSLQTLQQEIVEKYDNNARTRMGDLVDALRRSSNPPPKRKVRDMLDALGALKLRPANGRAKDLYRIERLLEELGETLTAR